MLQPGERHQMGASTAALTGPSRGEVEIKEHLFANKHLRHIINFAL